MTFHRMKSIIDEKKLFDMTVEYIKNGDDTEIVTKYDNYPTNYI